MFYKFTKKMANGQWEKQDFGSLLSLSKNVNDISVWDLIESYLNYNESIFVYKNILKLFIHYQ